MKHNPHLSSADLARLRRMLEHKRDALSASESADHELARGVTDETFEDGDVAERMIEQEAALRRDTSDRSLLAEIERALRKIEAGTYGFSEDSGAPIELDRLEAIPWARRTAVEQDKLAAR